MPKKKITLDQWGPIDAKVLYMSFWFLSMARSGSIKWEAIWPSVYGIFKKDRIIFVWDREDMNKVGFEAIDNIILQKDKKNKLWDEYQAAVNNLYQFYDKIIGPKSTDSQDLYKSLSPYAKNLYKLVTNFWDLGIIPELANFGAPLYLKNNLPSNIPKKELDEILSVLLASEKLSYHQQSEYELLQAALDQNFDTYTDKWFWVENGYYESKILTADYFKKQVSDLSKKDIENKLNKIKNYSQIIKKQKKDIINKYNLSSDIVEIADSLADSIWWQDHRKGIALWSDYLVDIFCQAAAHKLKIDIDDILHYTAEEWLKLFDKTPIKLSSQVLKQRINLSLFEINSNLEKVVYSDGQKAKEIIQKFNLENKQASEHTELKGTPVNKGKIIGKAKVLLSYRQADKMEQGDILIAPMTSPDYIIAMRKSAAIVTDVGGLMSHAAIIARELGVPCIVGTKNATAVFEDNDQIEVNADEGLVRKI